jgi:hypothetical protein
MNETSILADRFSFDPLPSMKREDADIVLIAISAGAIDYRHPVEDPLFSAHQMTQHTDDNSTWYNQDWAARALGCTEQASLTQILRRTTNLTLLLVSILYRTIFRV